MTEMFRIYPKEGWVPLELKDYNTIKKESICGYLEYGYYETDNTFIISLISEDGEVLDTGGFVRAVRDFCDFTLTTTEVAYKGVVPTLISTKNSTGMWTLTGLTIGQPVYLHTVGTASRYLSIISGADTAGFQFACGRPSSTPAYNTVSNVIIPTDTTLVLDIASGSGEIKAYY